MSVHDRAMNLMSDKPLRKCSDGLWRRHTTGRSGGIPGYVMMDLFYRWLIRFEQRESGLVAVLRLQGLGKHLRVTHVTDTRTNRTDITCGRQRL